MKQHRSISIAMLFALMTAVFLVACGGGGKDHPADAPPKASGSVNFKACDILKDQGGCSGELNWVVNNVLAADLGKVSVTLNGQKVSGGIAIGPLVIQLSHGTNVLALLYGSTQLASVSFDIGCAGNSLNWIDGAVPACRQPTGSLKGSPTFCTVPDFTAACQPQTLPWTSLYALHLKVRQTQNGTTVVLPTSGDFAANGSTSVTILIGQATFALFDDAHPNVVLDTVTISAICPSQDTRGGVCQPVPVPN